MKKIVVSGINFTEGGPLTIYKECLSYIEKNFLKDYKITTLVHDRNLFSEFSSEIDFIEFKDAKKSYLKRCYYEYVYFKKLSREIKPYLWFSLHDITPDVIAEKTAVYCHNPIIFYKMEKHQIWKEWKLFLFSKFYKYIYKINIRKNDYVIVQQNWIREEFEKIFNINNVVVAHPDINLEDIDRRDENKEKEENTFIFASFPRVFKNFEIICEAVKILEEKGINNFKVYLTIKGNENRYSEEIYNKYKNLKCLEFTGLLRRDILLEYYRNVKCVIFPSKLETWGLPITEAKAMKKPLLLADLPYSHETLGDYEKVMFFNTELPYELAEKMEKFLGKEEIIYEGNKAEKIKAPYCRNWKELFEILK